MAAGIERLSARAVATRKPGRYGDGGGLWLVVSKTGSRKWVYRFSMNGRVTETGLGSATLVSLSEAREAAREARRQVRAGINPIEARRAAARAAAGIPTFGAVADTLLQAKAREWRSLKHQQQWGRALTVQAAALRELPVDEVGVEAILAVLTPLWHEMPETADRLRSRIAAVLDAAKAQGFRQGENPAAWRGHLAHILPRKTKVAAGHFQALPYMQVPSFMARLRAVDRVPARALELLVLTACRSGEIYGALWREFDLDGALWTVPPERTKQGRLHQVPLPLAAVSLLKDMQAVRTCDFVFPSSRGPRKLAHTAMAKVLRQIAGPGPTCHGFRSAFRDWAGDMTDFAREVAEAALGHETGNLTERAYRRSTALAKRRDLMEAWAKFCG